MLVANIGAATLPDRRLTEAAGLGRAAVLPRDEHAGPVLAVPNRGAEGDRAGLDGRQGGWRMRWYGTGIRARSSPSAARWRWPGSAAIRCAAQRYEVAVRQRIGYGIYPTLFSVPLSVGGTGGRPGIRRS